MSRRRGFLSRNRKFLARLSGSLFRGRRPRLIAGVLPAYPRWRDMPMPRRSGGPGRAGRPDGRVPRVAGAADVPPPGGTGRGFLRGAGDRDPPLGGPEIPYIPSRDVRTIYYRADELLYTLPPLGFYIEAAVHLVLGEGLGPARLASALMGMVAVALVYGLARPGSTTVAGRPSRPVSTSTAGPSGSRRSRHGPTWPPWPSAWGRSRARSGIVGRRAGG